jgi:hypothetical protein
VVENNKTQLSRASSLPVALSSSLHLIPHLLIFFKVVQEAVVLPFDSVIILFACAMV